VEVEKFIKSRKRFFFTQRILGDHIDHIESLKMIVTHKVEELNSKIDKKHKFKVLDEPVVVYLIQNGNCWLGLTHKLKRGMYRCKIVYNLKWERLGEERVVIDRHEETDQPLFVIAE
jgi:hypothetical protein